MSNCQTINTDIGDLEATFMGAEAAGAQCVHVRTGYDNSLPRPLIPVKVRKIPYSVGIAFTRDGDVIESRISRPDGKAVSDSARKLITDAAKGVFGAYIENQGMEVFDLADLAALQAEKSDLLAQLDALGDRVNNVNTRIACVEERLTK